MISYVHPSRTAVTSADAPAVRAGGSVRMRRGQEVNLSTVVAQREADERARAARAGD